MVALLSAAGLNPEALVFRDVNLLAVTDVHSWLAGGDRESPPGEPPVTHQLDAGFGDLVSFRERARAAALAQGKDVFLFDNGDVIDGTGLSNTAPDHISHLLPLLKDVQHDALTCGNHELYSASTVMALNESGFARTGSYVTSNLHWTATGALLGSPYKVLIGPASGVRLLVFGFMYEMSLAEGRCTSINVSAVHETVRSSWFVRALHTESADAIVVLAHMDARDSLLRVIVNGIRAVLPSIPVQIIAGHSHMRQVEPIDSRAIAFEPGNYFNTIGVASFDLPNRATGLPNRARGSVEGSSSSAPAAGDDGPTAFHFLDLDTNRQALASVLNLSATAFPTPAGLALDTKIRQTRVRLGLTRVLGCSSSTFYQGQPLTNLYIKQVLAARHSLLAVCSLHAARCTPHAACYPHAGRSVWDVPITPTHPLRLLDGDPHRGCPR